MKYVYARKSKEIERKNDFDLLLTTMEELDLFEYKLNIVTYGPKGDNSSYHLLIKNAPKGHKTL